jgi:hypothetical protein
MTNVFSAHNRNAIFDSIYRENPITMKDDPLVLSVRLKKLVESSGTWYRLQDPEVKSAVIEEDVSDSEKIKDYYKRKVLLETLKTGNLSSYRKALMSLMENKKEEYTPQQIGLFVSLPYFYEEDSLLENMKSNYSLDSIKRVTPNLAKQIREVNFVTKTKRFINKTRHNRYWFSNDNNELCMIQLPETNNALINFFESYISKNNRLMLDTPAVAEFYPIPHYKLFDFRLA